MDMLEVALGAFLSFSDEAFKFLSLSWTSFFAFSNFCLFAFNFFLASLNFARALTVFGAAKLDVAFIIFSFLDNPSSSSPKLRDHLFPP